MSDTACHVYYQSSEDMSLVGDGGVKLIFTSPPYWNMKDYGHPGQIGQESYDEYLNRLVTVWKECGRVATSEAVMVINVRHMRHKKVFYPLPFDIARTMPSPWRLWDVMFWYIPNALPQSAFYQERLFDSKVEYLLLFIKGDPDGYLCHKPRIEHTWSSCFEVRDDKVNPKGRCLSNLLRIPAYKPPNIKDREYHQAAFPEELPALFIETYTDKGDIVLDPFLGSGTTAKVARNMGRAFEGFEINPDFQKIISARVGETWLPPDWKELDNLWAHFRQQPRRHGRDAGADDNWMQEMFGHDTPQE